MSNVSPRQTPKESVSPLRVLAHWGTNFAFVDQVMVSGANFVGGILLARAFGLYEFGRFALAWMVVECAASLQFAALLQPMLNIGPKQADGDRERYFHAVAAQQGLAALLLGMLAWLGAMVAGRLLHDSALAELGAPLCAAIVAYQLHNFFRRYFFLRERPLQGLVNDILRFGIQLTATLALPLFWHDPAASNGLWIIAGACAVSSALGAGVFGPIGWNGTFFRRVVARHWEFSKWLIPSAVMFWMTSQAFLVLSGIVLGAAVTGGLKAVVSITGLLNILLLSLDNFAPAQASRAFHVGGLAELRRYMVRLAILIGVLMLAVVAVLNLAPELIVRLLYGEKYEGIGYLVRWFCAPAVVFGLGSILIIWAAAMEWTRLIFLSYAAATIFTVAAAYPLTRSAGIAGVVAGSLLVECIRVLVLSVGLWRWSGAMTLRKLTPVGKFSQRTSEA